MRQHDPVYYHDYLNLDALLNTQRPVSVDHGAEAHDELLFIIVHQAYELWFKQIIHELDAVITIFESGVVAEREMGALFGHLDRIIESQRILVQQIDVLETMTPLDFLDFRDLLIPASGFESVQFRLIENALGVRPEQRIRISEATYTERFSPKHRAVLEASEKRTSLHDHVEAWLERTPFLETETLAFWEDYRAAVDRMLDREQVALETNDQMPDHLRASQLAGLARNREGYTPLFDESTWTALVASGHRRFSRRAFLAALLVNLYRDEPILQLPFRLLNALSTIDEGFITWRQRHGLMAMRMIGDRIGTGGTSGHEYLRKAADHSRVFVDLVQVPTFMIPRRELPALPTDVVARMRFDADQTDPPAA
jgi:tryptophan 2,3-dioxygenase